MAFSPETISLIKRTAGSGLSDDEFELFLYTCERTGLDPLARQIYAVKRGGKMSIQTGIDGYRLIADRTGKLAGISDPAHTAGADAKYPLTASVTVKKLLPGGIIADFAATARWSEYNAGGPMWAKMAFLMLGKCAEALALRKAFPADLSGVYTTEEMAQADNAAQGDAVHAEVERQKAAYTPDPVAQKNTIVEMQIPPELDWSYVKSSGLLICRIVEVTAKSTAKKRDYLVIKLNNAIEGQRSATYFHTTAREALLESTGKVCKFMVSMSKDGKFINIDNVLEIDGVKPAEEGESSEFKAQLLASSLGLEAEELRELHGRYCHGSWDEVVTALETRKHDLENIPEVTF